MENKTGEKKNVATLVVIIAMLVISLPSAIYGLINHKSSDSPIEKEPTEEDRFHKDGKLNFYIGSTLFFQYTCVSEDCDYATGIIDDNEYNLKYYDESDNLKIGRLIQMRNVFLKDNGEVFHYFAKDDGEKTAFEAIKDYGIGIVDDYYIVKKDGKWGIVKMSDELGLVPVVDYKYDFIGVNKSINEDGLLLNTHFVVFNEGVGWNIVDNTGNEYLTTPIPSIVNYSNFTIVVKGEFSYSVYNYQNNLVYSGLLYSDIVGNYLIVVNKDKNLYVYSSNNPTEQIGATEKIEVDFNLDDIPITYYVNDLNKLSIVIRSTGDPKTVIY